ncbi:MAG: transposase [Pirellulales bacterium]
MYDYRRMTPSQREAVVEQRRARGHHWHKPPRANLGEGWYMLTAATFEHRHHFTGGDELSALERRLLEAIGAAEFPLGAWVVMPNHYHVLVRIATTAVAGKTLGPVHGRSAHYANQRDQMPGRQVWYKVSDRKVRSERHYWTCLHYILHNPVKHGFASNAAEWPWSCYADVLGRFGQEWVNNLVREYPLRDFGRGWDE